MRMTSVELIESVYAACVDMIYASAGPDCRAAGEELHRMIDRSSLSCPESLRRALHRLLIDYLALDAEGTEGLVPASYAAMASRRASIEALGENYVKAEMALAERLGCGQERCRPLEEGCREAVEAEHDRLLDALARRNAEAFQAGCLPLADTESWNALIRACDYAGSEAAYCDALAEYGFRTPGTELSARVLYTDDRVRLLRRMFRTYLGEWLPAEGA